MSFSRRRFLSTSALVSAAFVLKPAVAALGKSSPWSTGVNRSLTQTKIDSTSKPFHAYGRETFEPYVGDVFHVRVGKKTIDLKLMELTTVEPGSTDISAGKTVRTDCFSMKFHASKQLPATANAYHLSHAKLGKFDLFMNQASNGRAFVQIAFVNHLI